MADENGAGQGTEEQATQETSNDASGERERGLIAESKKYRQRAQAAEQQIEELKSRVLSDEDMEKFRSLTAAQEKAEQEKLEQQGEYDTLLAKKQEAYDAEIAKVRGETDAYKMAFEAQAVMSPIQVALAAKGVTQVDDAAFLLQGKFGQYARAKLDNGRAAVEVIDRSTGNPVIDADCEPGQTVSVEKMVEAFLATAAGKSFLPPSGDSGSGTRNGGGSMGVSKAELLSDDRKAAEFIREHGQEEYLKVTK